MGCRLRLAAAIALNLSLAPLAAQDDGAVLTEPIVITAQRGETDWLEAPAAIGAVDLRPAQQGAANLAVDEALQRLAGIYIQNRYNFAQGERLSVRGFGARSSFGIRGLRVLVDGLPLTMPDGQTQLDSLDLDLVESAELIRGPASALYGNAAGGVLLLSTQEPTAQPELELGVTAGEFGLRSLRLQGSERKDRLGGLAAAERTTFDGVRQHSGVEENALFGKLTHDGDHGRSTLILSVVDSKADDPGALTATEVSQNRRQAAANNKRFNAGEESTEARLGWLLQRRLGAEQELELRVFGGYRDFANRLPFGRDAATRPGDSTDGQVAFDRLHGGVGLQYSLSKPLLNRPNRLSIGLDYELQRDDRRRYENLLGGVRGVKMLDQLEKVDALGLYVADSYRPASRWTTTVAARVDSVRLAVDDNFGGGIDASGSQRLNEFSASAGIAYALTARQRLYANLGTGFETPTTNELANPDGRGFNPDLEPQHARSAELGLKGQLDRLRYDITLFDVRVRDELVRQESEDETGRYYYINADKTRRRGLEVSVDWQPQAAWRIGAAYTYLDATFNDYSADAGNDGNRLPGIPRQHLFLEAGYDVSAYYAAVELLAVDRLYVDDANSGSAPGYALVNSRAGVRLPAGEQQLELFVGLRNLFDRDYIANVRTNADPEYGRYYEPGPGRHVYAGAALRY